MIPNLVMEILSSFSNSFKRRIDTYIFFGIIWCLYRLIIVDLNEHPLDDLIAVCGITTDFSKTIFAGAVVLLEKNSSQKTVKISRKIEIRYLGR